MIKFLKWMESTINEHIASWVHLSMILCAFGSVANIYYSFMGMNHGPVPSAIISVGLGLGLALSAIMASSIPTRQRGRFTFAVVATLAIAAMSGGIQTAGYLAHGTGIAWALFYGFGIPIATEVLLAIDLTVKHDADKQQVLDNAEDILELRVSEAIAESLAELDVTKSKRYVERQVDIILRAKAQQLVAKMLPSDVESADIAPTVEVAKAEQIPTNADLKPAKPAEIDQAKRQASAQARKANAEERRSSLLSLLSQEHLGASIDELNKSEIARQMGSSPRTVQRDIDQLRDDGMLNGVVG
ncbi:MAG: hypothetical protein AAF702_49690 [Chloroflexota bacterium]